MSIRIFSLFIFLILINNIDFTLSRCCQKPFIFRGSKICADGDEVDGAYCGRGECNVFGCHCEDGCRTIYPLRENDIIGFLDLHHTLPRIICAGVVMNCTHMRFSGVINSKYRLQTSINIPGVENKEFNVTYVKSIYFDYEERAMLEFEELLPRTREVIDHIDVKMSGIWQIYMDNDLAVKLNTKSFYELSKEYYKAYPAKTSYPDE